VTILGFVPNPCVQAFRMGDRLSHAIAAAGGAMRSSVSADTVLEIGDLSSVSIHHRDGTQETVDMEADIAGASDPLLQPGDTIVVPRRELVYYAVGHVGIQGRHTLPPGSRVLDLFTAARGAPLPDRVQILQVDADLENCVLARADGTQLTIDMRAVAQNPASEMNVELVPGDSLWVPESDRRVIVGGYVTRPGYFQYREGDTVADVIAMAGGLIISAGGASYMDDGDPHNILVIHDDGTQDTVDITREDLVLQPGDEIRVPYAQKRVTVLGYVEQPGFVLWHEGDTVLDMIAAAGGPLLEDADRFSAVVIRRTDGEPEFIRVDLSGAHDMDSPEFNVEVLPDDIVMVPKSDHTDYRSWLTNVRDALSITNLIGALF
jgi:protein involved in polysaccharide export with SLBB domain